MNSLTVNAAAEPQRPGRAALTVAGLRKQYAGVSAVDDVSFTVACGEIVGLPGPNGAGKTTTINMIRGILESTAGRTGLLARHSAEGST